jgi:polyhydroxyalkanoate synthesis regulator phasin
MSFCISGSNLQGKEVLQDLVRHHRNEYDQLTRQQQAELVHEFEEHKSTKATALRISSKARVTDVNHTLRAVEQEVCTLLI